MGGDLEIDWGDGPPNIWGGGRPNVSPTILRSIVIGCEAKYELSKKGVKEEFFVLKSRFLVKKSVM